MFGGSPNPGEIDAADRRPAMGQFIVDQEARRDRRGRIQVYRLPSGDGGGSFEVAGINDRYHPVTARHLRRLIEAGMYELAERSAVEAILAYTDVVTHWTEVPAIEAYLRDTAFNRGPTGALRTLQMALGVANDGRWGPVTQAALRRAERDPAALLAALRGAREWRERIIAPPVGARAKFWVGLCNRWDAAQRFAEGLLA